MSIRLAQRGLLLAFALCGSAHAATFYVSNGGSDSADGRSPETAWATVGKVNSYSFSAGDSVLFEEGDVWKGAQLKIAWSGTSTKPAIVGAYYVEGGQAKVGFRSSRPAIDGNHKIPSDRYGALVLVSGDRVRVQDLAIVNSEGRGITFDRAESGEAVNLSLSDTFDSAIKFLNSPKGLVANCYVTEAARVYRETGGAWAAAIAAVGSNGMTLRGNKVFHVYGEGINVNHGSADATIEQNFVFGARAVGIYADASPRPTIRYNIVVGTADSSYWRSGGAVGGGIVLNNENYHYKSGFSGSTQTKNAKIYDNLVANTGEGIGIWGQHSGSSFDNTLIYNNTLVDNTVQFDVIKDVPMPGSQFINNILLSLSSGTSDVKVVGAKGLTAKSNYFSQGDPGGAFSDPGNQYQGLELARMSGWRSFTDPQSVSWQDFRVAPGAPTIGKGDLTPMKTATSSDSFDKDFNRKPHNAPPDMGATRFDLLKRVPGKPGGLKTVASVP
jgi:hypothetical protein